MIAYISKFVVLERLCFQLNFMIHISDNPSFSTYLLSTYNEPGAVLFIGESKMNKLSDHTELTFWRGQLEGSNIKGQSTLRRNVPRSSYAFQMENILTLNIQ